MRSAALKAALLVQASVRLRSGRILRVPRAPVPVVLLLLGREAAELAVRQVLLVQVGAIGLILPRVPVVTGIGGLVGNATRQERCACEGTGEDERRTILSATLHRSVLALASCWSPVCVSGRLRRRRRPRTPPV